MGAWARARRHAAHAAVCEVLEPWAHGTVVRATRYPSYFDFNLVRVEENPAISAQSLVAFADEALAGSRTAGWISISSMPPSDFEPASRPRA
jgi:hypothetical protein